MSDELIREVKQALSKAEARINHIESFDPKIDVPSLNEIRYGFHHFLRFLTRDGDDHEDHGKNTLKHLKRALYDCYQSEAIFTLKQYSNFENTYVAIYLPQHIPDYFDWVAAYADLKEIATREQPDREKYCEQLEEKLQIVRPIHRKLLSARIELAKIVNLTNIALKEAAEKSVLAKQAQTAAEQQLHIVKEQLRQMEVANEVAKKNARIALLTVVVALVAIVVSKWF